MRQRSQGRAQAQTAQDVTKAMIKKAKRRTCRSFGVSGAVRAPSPAIPPWPTLTILRPFQWLSVEHHVGQGHLGLCRGLCGGEAEGQSRGRAAAAPSVQSQTPRAQLQGRGQVWIYLAQHTHMRNVYWRQLMG